MKDFASLTEVGQKRSLRWFADRAIESYDLDAVDMRLIAQSFNTVYRVQCRGIQARLLRVGSSFQRHPRTRTLWPAAWQRELLRGLGLGSPNTYRPETDPSFIRFPLMGYPGRGTVQYFLGARKNGRTKCDSGAGRKLWPTVDPTA
jgi:hypothetical protein